MVAFLHAASITFSECTFLLPGGVLLTFDLMFGYWPDLAEEVRLWLDLAEEVRLPAWLLGDAHDRDTFSSPISFQSDFHDSYRWSTMPSRTKEVTVGGALIMPNLGGSPSCVRSVNDPCRSLFCRGVS